MCCWTNQFCILIVYFSFQVVRQFALIDDYVWKSYKKYKKIIPYNISDYLTPLALAVWFMDDGSKINNTVRIATNCFTYAEIENLSTVLYKKYTYINRTPTFGSEIGCLCIVLLHLRIHFL